jgi:predicted TIM-barrel fold metal-dependent hydrolase
MKPFKYAIVAVILSFFVFNSCKTTDDRRVKQEGPGFQRIGNVQKAQVSVIDAHNHLHWGFHKDSMGAANAAIQKMDELGISKMIIMPPPGAPGHRGVLDMSELMPVVRRFPERFACMGGGGSLNVMIHQTGSDRISPDLRKKFRAKALELLEEGAIGFGEFSVEHFSFSRTHPYESVSADHPLFLLLSDIAAQHGVPVDIHMEAITVDMPFPSSRFLDRSNQNPSKLTENMSAFERLISHNRKTKIIWSHVGWCNTGHRSVDLCRRILQRHPNLYMSFKLSPEGIARVRPLDPTKNSIKPEWLQLIRDFQDRFIIGTDQFYAPPGARRIGPQKTEVMIRFINLLPLNIAHKICVENPRNIFNLK